MNFNVYAGHLTRDPELTTVGDGVEKCTFTVAVTRPFKDKNGNRESDFIPCQAWRQQAAFITKYFRKGHPIMVQGSLQSRSYEDQEGKRHTLYTVNVDHAMFPPAKSKKEGAEDSGTSQPSDYQPPEPPPEIPDEDEKMPF